MLGGRNLQEDDSKGKVCPTGHYCPPSAAEEIACPMGTYQPLTS
jgi:hypothetical protein